MEGFVFIKKNRESCHKPLPAKLKDIAVSREQRAEEFAAKRTRARQDQIHSRRNFVEDQKVEERLQRLAEWRKQKELKKKKQKSIQKKPFVVGVVSHKAALFEPLPPVKNLPQKATTSQSTRITRKMATELKGKPPNGNIQPASNVFPEIKISKGKKNQQVKPNCQHNRMTRQNSNLKENLSEKCAAIPVNNETANSISKASPPNVSFAPENAKFKPPKLVTDIDPKVFEKRKTIKAHVEFEPALHECNKIMTRSMVNGKKETRAYNSLKKTDVPSIFDAIKSSSEKTQSINSLKKNKVPSIFDEFKVSLEKTQANKSVEKFKTQAITDEMKSTSKKIQANKFEEKFKAQTNSDEIKSSENTQANYSLVQDAPSIFDEIKFSSEKILTLKIDTMSDGGSKSKNSIKKLREELDNEIARMLDVSKQWEKYEGDIEVPEFAQDLIRQAIGQTNLLITKKMRQYRQLIDQCEADVERTGEGYVKVEDLHGFWDMVYLQVLNIDKRFQDLGKLRDQSWIIKEKTPKTREQKKVQPICRGGKSKIKDFIEAARRKAQGKEHEETKNETNPLKESSPPKTPQLAMINSNQSYHRLSRTPKELINSARKCLFSASPVTIMKVNQRAKQLLEMQNREILVPTTVTSKTSKENRQQSIKNI